MKQIKISDKAYKALQILKEELRLTNDSEAVISVIHTAIVNIYMTDGTGYMTENPVIKRLEKAIGWKRPLKI